MIHISKLPRRRGLSLMEVLFAVGVLMVGLLGIASVLTVGTKNAASALRSDASTSAVENQVSNAVARFGKHPAMVDVPVPSLNGFNGNAAGVLVGGIWAPNATYDPARIITPNKRYNSVPVATTRNAFPNLDPADPAAPPLNQAPVAAPAFCVDPAFLAAADNLRPDMGAVDARTINHYDRTKFPCFDVNYSPGVAPGEQMKVALSTPITPRMLRVAVSDGSPTNVPTDAVAQALLSERDGLPLTRAKDKTLPPSLFFRRVGITSSKDQFSPQKTGSYSSLVTFVPTNSSSTNYEVTVVVYEGRQLTTKVLGIDTSTNTATNEVFPLVPFASGVWPLKFNTNFVPQSYPDEVMGLVTDASTAIQGGIGRFTFAHSNTCNPEVRVGQWLMLSRWRSDLGINDYAWYRVSSVLTSPRAPIAGDLNVPSGAPVYVTEVEVRGRDWIFHPLMVAASGAISNYPDIENMPTSNATEVALKVMAQQRVTIVVKAPRVVAVHSQTL